MNKAPSSEKINLSALNKEELAGFCRSAGLERYRADQLFEWIYLKNAATFEAMTNLPKVLRSTLSETAELKGVQEEAVHSSKDGTRKWLFRLFDGHLVESVLIPEFYPDGVADRLTVCVSSQVGCLFGCRFCATGKMGLKRNLSIGEITGQVLSINSFVEKEYGKRINNIVYMGMGEPFHNYQPVIDSASILSDTRGLHLSPKRITISTVGLPKQIRRYTEDECPWNLAVSLHAADDAKRNEIMPINKKMDLASLRDAITAYYQKSKKHITYEYLLFDQFNDSVEDARKLAKISRWVPSKINIIMYNHVEGVSYYRAKESRLQAFMAQLKKQGVRATVRRSRGDDIEAGCGQLVVPESL
ncbi:23S rRNA (adenine(2503)-C(2))-methyltransferase RlmN [Balneolaceae bacterium ANBcel3]|nr:23S rRNA (adenine(2503)-C(2))-methyltransferase RlmN [Balneolaceae bacterium ANBcel3]